MGRTLAVLGRTMTSEEFGLHMALEVERRRAPKDPNAEPDEVWGAD